MASKFLQRLTLAAVLLGGLGLVQASPAAATRPVRRTARPEAARGFNLFAGAVNVMMNVNRIQCNINNIGETCVDPTNSPVVGGGYWPKGTPDQYIFNGGLQIAATLPGNRAVFPWAGDTVGAFFFDPRGDQAHGQGLTNVFNGLSAADLAEWPTAAYANDPSLYDASLIGRRTVSQQDTWVRYWDGNTQLTTGRQHPMGLLVDQRGLMWNFPSGNQDIVYFLYRFINITARDATRYAGLSAAGYSAQDIADIVTVANTFQDQSEATFNVALPDTGWTFTNMYAAFAQDPDLGASGSNYSTAIMPFALGLVYKSNFFEPTWAYPADIFSAPFATAPGMEGVKYLRSPTNPTTGLPYGITMFTNTTNGAPFPDRVGVQALWRLMSGNLTAADGTCNADFRPAPTGQGMCQLVPTFSDTRFVQASGPFTLAAGQSAVIVVAYVHAASVAGYFTSASATDLKPGIPGTIYRFATGVDTIRTIERIAGMSITGNSLASRDLNANGVIEQTEIPTVPRSLLNKALVAQAVFDAKFLLPFAPETPEFFLIPGDGQVTIAWGKSATEDAGDPYFSVASDPLNSLYDPNFRRYDVEGYRIWRGRSEAEMEVIAAFDFVGTTMVDKTGQFFYTSNPQCAPELGIVSTCPVPFLPTGAGPTYNFPLVGDVIQIPPGGRTQLASLNVLMVTSDTAVVGGNSGLPALRDTGVPFVFVDHNVRVGFRYFYSVTAFDVNSVASGPSSLESPLVTRSVTPRVESYQVTLATAGSVEMLGADGAVLNPAAALPTIGATTGIFSGPMPPTDAVSLDFSFLPGVIASGASSVRIDSVIPGSTLTNTRPAYYWVTGEGSGGPVSFAVPILGSSGGYEEETEAEGPFPSNGAVFGNVALSVGGAWGLTMKGRGDANAHPAGPNNGPRWWTGSANENTDDPNGINCYVCALADLSRNAGAIAGVDIFDIKAYRTVATTAPPRDIEGITSTVFRAADFKWYWGANGAVDSVVDVTHHVRVPFSTVVRASWGILNDSSFVNVTAASTRDKRNTVLTWTDYACVAPFPLYLGICGGSAQTPAVFQDHARLSTVAFKSSAYSAVADTMSANGNGFILYLNGSFFVMRMAALPATGTVWNMRSYAGNVTGTVGSYGYQTAIRPAAVPGLRLRFSYTGNSYDPSVTADSLLARVHTVPDPYYVTNQLEITASTKVLRFVNLPSQAIIRIYSTSGILVNILTQNDPTGGGELVWNLRNRNNQFVASGVYFYHVETPDGRTKIGRFTVVNFAQ